MKVGVKVGVLARFTFLATCVLGGCSARDSAPSTVADTRRTEAQKQDDHAKAATTKPTGRQVAGDGHNDHAQGGHAHQHGGGHVDEGAPPRGSVKVGGKVPDFAVRTIDGQSIKLSELQKDAQRTATGVVVLSFWCSTCHSCRDVERMLAKLAKDYAGRAAVMALDANAGEPAAEVAAFLKKSGLELPVVLDPEGKLADLFGVNRTTTTVVIDRDGVLRYCGQFRRHGGGSAEDAVKAVLAGQEVAIKTTPHVG